jgi:hypothetical protein
MNPKIRDILLTGFFSALFSGIAGYFTKNILHISIASAAGGLAGHFINRLFLWKRGGYLKPTNGTLWMVLVCLVSGITFSASITLSREYLREGYRSLRFLFPVIECLLGFSIFFILFLLVSPLIKINRKVKDLTTQTTAEFNANFSRRERRSNILDNVTSLCLFIYIIPYLALYSGCITVFGLTIHWQPTYPGQSLHLLAFLIPLLVISAVYLLTNLGIRKFTDILETLLEQ